MMKYIAFGMIAALVIDATIHPHAAGARLMALLREDFWWAPTWSPGSRRRSATMSGSRGWDAWDRPRTPLRREPERGSDEVRRASSVCWEDGNVGANSGAGAHEDGPVPFAELMARLEHNRRNDRKAPGDRCRDAPDHPGRRRRHRQR
ncbi:hypothetical protein [Corynebacterium variabile]